MKYFFIFLLALVIFIVAITLGAHNDQVVVFNYLIAKGEYRISTLLAILFGSGFVLGWLVCGLFYLSARISLGRAKRKIKRLESQFNASSEKISLPAISKE